VRAIIVAATLAASAHAYAWEPRWVATVDGARRPLQNRAEIRGKGWTCRFTHYKNTPVESTGGLKCWPDQLRDKSDMFIGVKCAQVSGARGQSQDVAVVLSTGDDPVDISVGCE
jgi:hypothetical protein